MGLVTQDADLDKSQNLVILEAIERRFVSEKTAVLYLYCPHPGVDLQDRHLIVGNCPRLVEADGLHRAESTNGVEIPYEDLATPHVFDPERQSSCRDSGETFRHRRNRQRNGCLEHLDKTAASKQAQDENQSAHSP